MSAHDIHAGHAAHGDHHGHQEHDDLHVTKGDYVKGFILAVILTVIPFGLVMGNVIENRTTAVLVLGVLAMVQVVVHMVYFLHMNGKIQGGWTLLSTIFTVVFLGIAILGTLWVMFHMNANMMPAHSNPMAPQQQSVQQQGAEAHAPGAH